MPQEMNVLRCYSCEMFQVHIVKKATKWQCKVCNEKQSIQHVYYQGSGLECRLQVQHLNLTKQTTQQQELKAWELIGTTDDTVSETCQSIEYPANNSNKWAKYLSGPPNSLQKIGQGIDAEEGSFFSTNVELQSENELHQSDNCGNDRISPIKKRAKIELDSTVNILPLKYLDSTENELNRKFERINYTTENESTSPTQSLRNIVKINRYEAANRVKKHAAPIDKLVSLQQDPSCSTTEPKVVDFVPKHKSIFESNCEDFDGIFDF